MNLNVLLLLFDYDDDGIYLFNLILLSSSLSRCRSDVFLEPYLQQHGTVQVINSPSTPPPHPVPLQHRQLAQLHHVQVNQV